MRFAGNSITLTRFEKNTHCFRINILVALIICCSSLLISRLAYLQIAQYKRYETLSLNNQLAIIPLAPTRGIIVDRLGVVLAENISVYVLEIVPEHIKNLTQTIAKLRILLPVITDEDIKNFNHLKAQNRSFVPLPLKLKLSQDDVALFASHQHLFPGVSVKAQLMRHYPQSDVTGHLLGYVGRINLQELQKVNSANYRATNFIGKAGIEKFYEDKLHGYVGFQQVETDVSGRTLRVRHKKNPLSGEKLALTLDIRLQRVAYQAMKNKRGALVALNPKNGDILAMVSAPSYDPNQFINGINLNDYQQLTSTKDRPLFNRAIRGLYPPASTIKPFIALIGLDKGVIDPTFKIFDPGWFKLPGVSHRYRDWKKTGHGIVDLKRAIAVSCDTYFYQLGQRLGIAAIENKLQLFGYGQPTHIDLTDEAIGVVPSAQWKKSVRGISWYPGDTIITSIGQGFMLATPLQIADAVAAISQKGRRFRPHLLQQSTQNEHQQQQNYQLIEEYPVKLKNSNDWDVVTQAMNAVIKSDEGTGYRFGRTAAYSVAAKTGTAQVYSGREYEKKSIDEIPEKLRDHSLFIAFAPIENPEIALAVIVENDVSAALVAREVLDTYFQLKQGQ